MVKVRRTDDGRWTFRCPACGGCHQANDVWWTFNGDRDKPTFHPSIKVTGTRPVSDDEVARIIAGEKVVPVPTCCHSYVKDGMVQFLDDCTHALAGKTVEIPDWE